ncbi:MAG: hypothetical protein AAF404_19745, partial [Pseudomonadota bacterium]
FKLRHIGDIHQNCHTPDRYAMHRTWRFSYRSIARVRTFIPRRHHAPPLIKVYMQWKNKVCTLTA